MRISSSRLFSARLSTRVRTVLLVLLSFAMATPGAFSSSGGFDQSLEPADKDAWQSHYRILLQEAAELRVVAKTLRKDYSQAQQRNYPRGNARGQLLAEAEKTEARLRDVEAEIKGFEADGRRNGALPGWFDEVEDDPTGPTRPAAPAESDASGEEGRNPLYLDKD